MTKEDVLYFAGVEGGGSSSRVVIMNEKGEILQLHEGPGTNFFLTGIEEGVSRLGELIYSALKKLKLQDTTLVSLQNIGVFKPKNEEPYGPQNPKWTKWFQKKLCPCCFGRGCLVLNQGYLSEAGAYVVDEKLQLNVVPKTRIVHMAAPTFNYNILDRTIAEAWPKQSQSTPGVRFKGLPAKVGSMQKFVNGYVSATEFDYDRLVSAASRQAFRSEFERLVILDYIIRNTDRGSDNWLIKYEEVPNPKYIPSLDTIKSQESDDTALMSSSKSKSKACTQAVIANLSEKSVQGAASTGQPPTIPFVKIAAIDNGLAFPFKHPDEWRAYPFGWMHLKEAKVPFSAETRERLGPILLDITYIEQIVESLRQLFKIDSDYKNTIFDKQMSVMRGQILNINKAFQKNFSPYQLVLMTPLFMMRDSRHKEPKSRLRWSMYKKAKRKREPWFNR